jgi:N,N'-diacetylchitobiose transport system substrate-binding protein
VLQDSFVKIAQGGDVEQIAKELDAKIEEILNS